MRWNGSGGPMRSLRRAHFWKSTRATELRFMKTPLEAPEKQIAEETSVKPGKPAASVIDTSKMSKGQREALELAEASRDPLDDRGSFASNLFIGRYDFGRIYPFTDLTQAHRARSDPFLTML